MISSDWEKIIEKKITKKTTTKSNRSQKSLAQDACNAKCPELHINHTALEKHETACVQKMQ